VADEGKRENGSTGDDAVIRAVDVYKAFGDLEVLKGLNLEVRRNETMVVIGGSGCGKSVLLKHIIGLLRPDSGEVFFDSQKISEMSEEELARVRGRFGMVFQGSALFDSLTVKENVAFRLRRSGDYSEEEINGIVADKLRLVGLHGVENKMPAELSGGMKKRVGIARAIAAEPEVILYDEPTTGLDPIMADVVNELMLRVQENLCATSVVVTHDMKSAYKVADRIAMMKDGVIIETGTPEEIRNTDNEIVAQFIRGEARDYVEENV